jgi:DNA polymerase-3 subunit epsilon
MSHIVAIDFETANYARNSAIALGVSVIRDGVVTETKSWLFRPPGERIYIRPDFIDIHGITPADLKDKPYFDGVWKTIEPYLLDADLLLAHNAGFDRTVLHAVAEHYGIELPRYNWQCTVNLSRVTWPELYNHKLSTVCEHLSIPLKHHDPASDAEACARIFLCANENEAASV